MASVAPDWPRISSRSPSGIDDAFMPVRVRITVWAISGSVSSAFSRAATPAKAGTPGYYVVVYAEGIEAPHLLGDGAVEGGIAGMHARHILACRVGLLHLLDDEIEMHRRGVHDQRIGRCRRDDFLRHQRPGKQTDRTPLDQPLAAHGDQVGGSRPGADEIDSHCATSLLSISDCGLAA